MSTNEIPKSKNPIKNQIAKIALYGVGVVGLAHGFYSYVEIQNEKDGYIQPGTRDRIAQIDGSIRLLNEANENLDYTPARGSGIGGGPAYPADCPDASEAKEQLEASSDNSPFLPELEDKVNEIIATLPDGNQICELDSDPTNERTFEIQRRRIESIIETLGNTSRSLADRDIPIERKPDIERRSIRTLVELISSVGVIFTLHSMTKKEDKKTT